MRFLLAGHSREPDGGFWKIARGTGCDEVGIPEIQHTELTTRRDGQDQPNSHQSV